MRLVLVPITTRRTLLYCIRTNTAAPRRPNLADRVSAKVAGLWASWERRDSGWQRRVVDYGNHALRRVPYQEWGLKSVPPLSARRRSDELERREPVELAFPGAVIGEGEAMGILHKLGTEREAHHRMRLIWCFVAYRAWSHWRSIKGSQHVQFLVKNKLPSIAPSPILDAIYATPRPPPTKPPPTPPSDQKASESEVRELEEKRLRTPEEKTRELEEEMLLTPEIGKRLSVALEHPEIEVEIERALWQVQQQWEKERASRDSKGR